MKRNRNVLTHKLPQIIKVMGKELKDVTCRFYVVLIISVMLLFGFFSLSPAISSLMDSIVIRSTGTISTTNVTAISGSPEDIQAAIDAVAAAGGGTVYVPDGDFEFNVDSSKVDPYFSRPIGVLIPGGVNVIGAGGNKTILRATQRAPRLASMFFVDGLNNMSTRIAGITFIGNVTFDPATETDDDVSNGAVYLYNAIDFRVDHNTFTDFSWHSIFADGVTRTTRGVIDHNVFDNPYKDRYPAEKVYWAYGIGMRGRAYVWEADINNLLGKYEAYTGQAPIVYIEDNVFKRTRHAIASNQGAWYVARYNTVYEPRPKNFGQVDVHGLAGYDAPGGRGLEAYNNTIYAAAGYGGSQAMWLRGGGGLVFNNSFVDVRYAVMLFDDSAMGSPPPTYARVKDLYIWGNTYTNVAYQLDPGPYTEGVDYFLYQRAGYTPYPYPHPLTLGE